MSEFWYRFLFHFCKTDLFCRQGELNWLGWIVIGVGGFFLVICLFTSLLSIISWLFQLYPASYEDETENEEEEEEEEEEKTENEEEEGGEIIKLDEAKKALTAKKGMPADFKVKKENNNGEDQD